VPAKRVTAGNARKTTTVLVCVNASGQKMPPLILHKGKKLWDNMMGQNAFPNTSYAVSDNGWMTENVFANWFKNHFLQNLSSKPALLIYDGHLSHISMELIETAIESNVTILKLPPHTSHILQPLDVSVFKGIKDNWDSSLAEWARKNYGKVLRKSEFADILGSVWSKVKAETIINGFKKCGIFPFDATKISDSTFNPEKLNRFNLEKQSTLTQELFPANEIVMDATGLNYIQIPNEDLIFQNNSFESILLKTVSPASKTEPIVKKRRVDIAEIITKEKYLQTLKDNFQKKKLDEENKAKKKKKRTEAKERKSKRIAEKELQRNPNDKLII